MIDFATYKGTTGGIFNNLFLKRVILSYSTRLKCPVFFHFAIKEVKITMADEAEVQGPGIEQSSSEAPLAPNTDKLP